MIERIKNNEASKIALYVIPVVFMLALLATSVKGIYHKATGAIARSVVASLPKSIRSQGLDEEKYPYGGQRFTDFIDESYGYCGCGNEKKFYEWMEEKYRKSGFHYPGKEKLTLEGLLEAESVELGRMKDPAAKAAAEVRFANWLHRMVKTTITKFSLDRGFEFCNAIRFGERQCLLQSVLIAGMLQQAGADAGIVMVYANPTGETSNNGHVTVLIKLADGTDYIVDASDPEAFAPHTGLMARCADYCYVKPVYDMEKHRITGYRLTSDDAELGTNQIRTMDILFIDSQFWYYRGERAPGGVLSENKTKEGLDASVDALRTSIKMCPGNPLATFMLGRAYLALGDRNQAHEEIAASVSLYKKFGWVPDGPRKALWTVR